MPDVSVVTPAAVVPEDRLTLSVTDARAVLSSVTASGLFGPLPSHCVMCMAEE